MIHYIGGFFAGILFIYVYYRLLWCYSKLRGKEFKLIAKYGKESEQLKRFKRKFKTYRCGYVARLLLFLIFALPVAFFLGTKALAAFLLGVLMGNLALFYLSFKRKL